MKKFRHIPNNFVPRGKIEGFPLEIVDEMCEQQRLQGSPVNPTHFEKSRAATKRNGGFNWKDSMVPGVPAGDASHSFWGKVINARQFDLFFEKFDTLKKVKAAELEGTRRGCLRLGIRWAQENHKQTGVTKLPNGRQIPKMKSYSKDDILDAAYIFEKHITDCGKEVHHHRREMIERALEAARTHNDVVSPVEIVDIAKKFEDYVDGESEKEEKETEIIEFDIPGMGKAAIAGSGLGAKCRDKHEDGGEFPSPKGDGSFKMKLDRSWMGMKEVTIPASIIRILMSDYEHESEEFSPTNVEDKHSTYVLYRWIPVGPHLIYRTFLSKEKAPSFGEAVKQYCKRKGIGWVQKKDNSGESDWYIDGRKVSFEIINAK